MNSLAGSDEYIQDLLENYSDTVVKVAFTYVKNLSDAEDIAQEVFISMMTHNVQFVSREHEKAYMIRATINKSKNFLKSSWFKRTVPLEEHLSYMMPEETGLLQEVMALPVKYRTVIHLYYYENYSIKEIAEILQKKTATVGTMLARGRNLLKSKLKGGDIDAARQGSE